MKTHIAATNNRLTTIIFALAGSMFALSCNTMSILQPSTATPTNSPTLTASPTNTPTPTITITPTWTPTRTPTPTPTRSIPSGTPVSKWHNIPIRSDALAAEGGVEERWYTYVTEADQDLVLDFYLEKLPPIGWEIDWVSPNDQGGYIIYRKNVLDFIFIFEDQERGLTIVSIFLSTGSPSLNP